MTLLVGLLGVTTVVTGGLAMKGLRRERRERLRDQARLRVVEGQLAALRALLLIGAAEHVTRARMREVQRRDLAEDWGEPR
jgi:hypothetical protein